MKKVALSLVVLFAAAMVACSGNKENTEAAPATDTPLLRQQLTPRQKQLRLTQLTKKLLQLRLPQLRLPPLRLPQPKLLLNN